MADFNERRAKIDAAAIHGNPTFGKDQLAALNAHSLVDIAEALTALVGIGADVTDRLGGWERIAGVAELPDGRVVSGTLPVGDVDGDDDQGDDDVNDPDLDIGDIVAALADPTTELGVVIATGSSEGRAWLRYEYHDEADDDDEQRQSGKVWADQLTAYVRPPAETAATNPADGAERRRKVAEAHLEHVNTEAPVEYEQVTFDTGKDGREFDVPIGIPGAPVVVKSKGAKA
jgi:hypothetical protein